MRTATWHYQGAQHPVQVTLADITVLVSDDVQVDRAFAPFLMGHAIGTHGHICVAGGTAFS